MVDIDRVRFFKLHSSLSKSDQDKIREVAGCLKSFPDITVYQAVNLVLAGLKADRKKFGEIPWEFGSPKKLEDDLVIFAKKYGFWRPGVKQYGKYDPETGRITKL
jgi:hypothetical protein